MGNYLSKKTRIILIGCFCFLLLLSLSNVVFATNLKDAFMTDSVLDKAADKAGYDIGNWEVDNIVVNIIKAVLYFLGVIFLLLMVYGGYLWMTARGEEQQVTKAKDTIRMAIIGLCIVVAAYAISIFVISKFTAGTLITPPAQ